MEEVRKRNEASMRRKHNPNGQVNGTDESGPSSPTSTGAMDSLLEKLRAAAPQARDQRDRRRRARLKDRHQVRIASGQNVPELPELKTDMEGGNMLSSEGLDGEAGGKTQHTTLNGEDVADRAASLLQGLRGSEGGDDNEGSGSTSMNNLRARRRIDSANDERRARRSRRGLAGGRSSSGGRSGSLDDGSSGDHSSSTRRNILGEDDIIPEHDGLGAGEGDETGGSSNEPTMSNISTTELLLPPTGDETLSAPEGTPTTIISPPSPG